MTAANQLLRLYTQLGDTQQRQRALRMLEAGKARLVQYPGTGQGLVPGPDLALEDTAAELETWRSALEATTGVLVFLTLAQDAGKPVFGLRGQVSSFMRASTAALQGLQCAFPEELAREGTHQAIQSVLEACRQVFTHSFPEDAVVGGLEPLLEAIQEALLAHLG